MRQTDKDVEDAVDSVRQRTAAPIERFFNSFVAARVGEDRNLHDASDGSRPKRRLRRLAEGFMESIKNIASWLAKFSSMQTLARVVHRDRRKRSRDVS